MGVTNYDNGVSSFGMPVLSRSIAPGGSIFWLNPSHADASDGNGFAGVGAPFGTPMATLPGAFALTTANKNDIIIYVPGSTSLNLTAQLVWNKNFTHLIGFGAQRMAQRSRIFQGSAATGLSPLINITASFCHFENLLVFQGVADATSLLDVQVTGRGNYFFNVHFAGGGNATMAIDNCASLMVNGGEENTFQSCRFGITTIPLATGGNVLRFDGRAKENYFINSEIAALVGNVGARLVELVDGAALDQINWFRNVQFVANSVNQAVSLESAWEIPALTGTTPIVHLDANCHGRGFDDWDDNDRGLLYLAAGTITAGGNAGIAQVSNST